MSEFIITSDQLERLIEGIEHDTGREISRVVARGTELVAIVRCRDCKRFSLDNSDHDYRSGWWCHRWNTDMVKPDGYCAWGVRRADG